MRKLLSTLALGSLVLAGCTTQSATSPLIYPIKIDGIPVRHFDWDSRLPYVGGVLWRNVRPKTFRLSPKTAVHRATTAFGFWHTISKLTQIIYVQSTGTVGGAAGNQSSAYLVEFVGSSAGQALGPYAPKPPLVAYTVVSVNGRTGHVQVETSGIAHGVVRGGRILRTVYPEPSWAKVVRKVSPCRYPTLISLAGSYPPLRGYADSVWRDGSVAEYQYKIWDPLYVFSGTQNGDSFIATCVQYATTVSVLEEWNINGVRPSPRRIGRIDITYIRGSSVSFTSSSGVRGAYNLITRKWSFR